MHRWKRDRSNADKIGTNRNVNEYSLISAREEFYESSFSIFLIWFQSVLIGNGIRIRRRPNVDHVVARRRLNSEKLSQKPRGCVLELSDARETILFTQWFLII